MTKIFSLRDQKYFPAVTRKLNKIFFIKNLAPQMSYAVILVAWLAMMPQLMPKQRKDFFDWAMSTLLPAVTLVVVGGNSLGPNLMLPLSWCMPKGMRGMAESQKAHPKPV
jgi:hypothetical protein